jgi:hypothetical protein
MMDSNEHNSETVDDAASHKQLRKRLVWIFVALSLLVLLLITPPLLNVNRLRRRIATSMSASLGRPVHLDGVSLHILPIPGFTLQNLVVSEDPDFGDEPVIRANTVEVTLRPSSLWRREVEISTVRFVEPSLNLVRNAQGQWNLQSLLMHAAQVDSAPTAQTTAGPAPRFPYIEATAGRVNLKLGSEKQPFSLTDADFALWLPSPEQWRIRFVGKPARTDTNVADAGTVRLEGQLHRAAQMADVPVDLRASWYDAPLGEASKLLTGSDAEWRGRLNVDATLAGPLSTAKVTTAIHINDLRRADFVPAKLLILNIECNTIVDVTNAVMHDPSCNVPTATNTKDAGQVVAIADQIVLPSLNTPGFGIAGFRLGMTNVADDWIMDWARLFSQRVPAKASLGGIVAGSVLYVPASGKDQASWSGEFHDTVKIARPATTPATVPTSDAGSVIVLQVMGTKTGMMLVPLNVASAETKLPPVTLAGDVTLQGYTLHVAGSTTPQQFATLRSMLPPLSDGFDEVLPELKDANAKSFKVDVTCTRQWRSPQVCSPAAEPQQQSKKHRR